MRDTTQLASYSLWTSPFVNPSRTGDLWAANITVAVFLLGCFTRNKREPRDTGLLSDDAHAGSPTLPVQCPTWRPVHPFRILLAPPLPPIVSQRSSVAQRQIVARFRGNTCEVPECWVRHLSRFFFLSPSWRLVCTEHRNSYTTVWPNNACARVRATHNGKRLHQKTVHVGVNTFIIFVLNVFFPSVQRRLVAGHFSSQTRHPEDVFQSSCDL